MLAKDDYLDKLKAAILIEHRCTPTHKGTYFVQETTLDGEPVWEGNVEVFSLAGRGKFKTCYAWQYADDLGKLKIFVVLENQFIDSPARAVQGALFTDAQPPVPPVSKNFDILKRLLADCRNRIHKIATTLENLDATVQNVRDTTEAIAQKRRA